MIWLILIQFVCTLNIFFCVWVMITNQWTANDRQKFLSAVQQRPFSGPSLLSEYQKVKYNRHLLARVFGRDPWKLYDPKVLEAVTNPVSEFPVVHQAGHFQIDANGQARYGNEETKH